MENNKIHVIFYPSSEGYSAYSEEMDGLQSDAKTLRELMDKIRHIVETKVEALYEVGENHKADELKQSEIVFMEK